MNSKIKVGSGIALSVFMCILFVLLTVFYTPAQNPFSTGAAANTEAVYTEEILQKTGIELGEHDEVLRSDSGGCVMITVLRAFEVSVNYRGESLSVYVTGGTVEEAIAKAGIALTGAEDVEPSLDTEVYEGMTIDIKGDCSVLLSMGGETAAYTTKDTTVGEFLSDLGIVLGEDDSVTPSLDTKVTDGTQIFVEVVEFKEETTTEIIDYELITRETSAMAAGTSKIEQYGVEGERTVVSRNKYVDGVLVESEVISSEVTRAPQDQVKLIGTGVSKPSYQKPSSSGGASVSNSAGTFKDANGNTVSYKKKLTGTSTAYYAAEGALTATGVPAYVGGVAVNPNVIPYGSKLYIVSSDGRMVYGYATAVDTGGALMSGSVLVDVFYPTYNECVQWGRRNVTVYVLN